MRHTTQIKGMAKERFHQNYQNLKFTQRKNSLRKTLLKGTLI